MTRNIGRMKVSIGLAILLTTIILSHVTSNTSMTIVSYDTIHSGILSQTYTDHDAIFIDGNADFLSQASTESWEGAGSAESPIVIEGYRISDTSTEGIKIWNVDLHWKIRDCLIEGGPPYACGFYIDNCSNGVFSNNIIRNRDVGIQAYEGTYNCSFLNNQILNNQDTAFKVLSGMGNCIISGNNFSDNIGNNFWMTGGFNDSQITDNVVKGGQNGIRVTACLRSVITGNTVSDCGLDALVFPLSVGILVSDNIVRNTIGYGIMLSGDFAEIDSNTVVNSTASGIYLATGDNGTITHNQVVNSTEYGLKLSGTTANTSVSENSFIDNYGEGSQVLDDGENNTICNNHYSEWISPDENTDGIVDVAYSIGGDATNSDLYPIVDSAGTIPVSTTTNTSSTNDRAAPLDIVIIGAVGIAAVVLIAVIFLMKRR
ncbi:MAG: right-handed parallel beta-helix repeat-containing protein [Candidatus Thorarchaeota archaeon]